MSNFPKKGTRRLEVDGKVYLWRINSYGPDREEAHTPYRTELLVQPEGEGGTIWRRNWRTDYDWSAVTPVMVEDLIKERR